MSKTWKGVALTLVIFLALALLYNLFSRSGPSEFEKAEYDQKLKVYYDYLEKQDQRNIEYFEKLKEELAYSREIADRSMKGQERYELLLDRWEKQTDRMNSILLKLENK